MKHKHSLGLIGLIVGAVAVGAVLVHISAGPFSLKNKYGGIITGKIVELRDDVVDNLKGEHRKLDLDLHSYDTDQLVTIGSVVGGIVAILLAIGATWRREEARVCLVTASFGAMALILEYLNWHVIMRS